MSTAALLQKIELLENNYQKLWEASEKQRIDFTNLQLLVEEQKKIVEEQKKIIAEKDFQIKYLNTLLYGPKSEKINKTDKYTACLFNEAEDAAFSQAAVAEPTVTEPVQIKQQTVFRKKKKSKNVTADLPADLPREVITTDLPAGEQQCGCGAPLEIIGKEISKRLSIIPAEIKVIEEHKIKRACKCCDGIDQEGSGKPAIKTATGIKHLIPGGIATASLIAWSLVEKFEYALPFYRQEKRFNYLGIKISRTNLCNWAIQAAKACEPLLAQLERHIKAGLIINADETPVQVLAEHDRRAQSKSWMWVFKGGPPAQPAVLFRYAPSRGAQVAKDFLTGFTGWLQTDDYAAYHTALNELNAGKPAERLIRHALCWAHVRRKFYQSWKNTESANAKEALAMIGQLFELEDRRAKLPLPDFSEFRRIKAKEIFTAFQRWLLELSGKVLPSTELAKAVAYTLSNWTLLTTYIEEPLLTPSNNCAENAIRPFVVGRKNWLFSVTPQGAASSALLYSLIETVKLYKLNPWEYLTYILEKTPYAQTEADYTALLPWKITAAMIEQKN